MNNYLTILNFLRPYAGDTKYYKVEQLLKELGLKEEKTKKAVLSDLARLEYIRYSGGSQGGTITVYNKNDGAQSFGSSWYKSSKPKLQ